MPIYPPRNNSTKKSQILEYKIFEFLKSIENNESKEKLLIKSENVKTAKLNLLKSKLALLKNYKSSVENNKSKHLKEKYLKEMNKWKSISFEGVINFCKK